MSDTDVVIIGAGAAGIAAARHLTDAGIRYMLVEARSRIGGRAWTITHNGHALDLGCGWLHSAENNPWSPIAEAQGRTIDKTPPPWRRRSPPQGFPFAEQESYFKAMNDFFERRAKAAESGIDRPASEMLAPNDRWNEILNAVSTYASGTELERVSLIDLENYEDTGVNWRVVEGYGTTIVAHMGSTAAALETPVRRIDHSGKHLRIETDKGTITADQAIVTLPTDVIAENENLFAPALPNKIEAARELPLGLADKLFIGLERAEDFEKDSRLFGRTDRTATAVYHMRPFERPMIEAFFGGRNADELERAGPQAFFDFARTELTGILGADFARRIKPLHIHPWRTDPFARGSYSSALPGKADCRAVLAAPVDQRLFFAGEACSKHDYSTAHGAYRTGLAAAGAVIAARQPR